MNYDKANAIKCVSNENAANVMYKQYDFNTLCIKKNVVYILIASQLSEMQRISTTAVTRFKLRHLLLSRYVIRFIRT